jgi:hypothetical protein
MFSKNQQAKKKYGRNNAFISRSVVPVRQDAHEEK